MAQRRPITTHPAFVPLVALWFAALFGLGIAVLPAVLVERALGAIGLDAMAASASGRMVASGVAALAGGLLGLVVAMAMARRGRGDPRPIYAEQDAPLDHPLVERAIRRPLR
ncbi:MAG: hypothetical protein EOP59_17570, partial [Sphingomonadales bacterium]